MIGCTELMRSFSIQEKFSGKLKAYHDPIQSHTLHGAAYYNSPEAIVILLCKGTDPDIQDSNGDTSLHSCRYFGLITFCCMVS